MPYFRFPTRASAAVLTLLLAAACGAPQAPPNAPGPTRDTRERAYRANNVGVALLEQLKYPEAANAFKEALGIDPTLAIGHLNLGLALLYEQDLDGAAKEAAAAATRMADAPQPPYVLGLIARAQNRNDEARKQFERVRQLDPDDVGAAVNLAQINLEDRRYDEAIAGLQPIVAKEPYHVTASYVLGLALTRGGKPDEGQPLLQRAQDLRRESYAVTFGTGYLEQGRYAEAIASTGAEPELVDPSVPPAKFTAADLAPPAAAPTSGSTAPLATPFGQTFAASDLTDAGMRGLAASLGGAQTLIDVNGDGQLELVIVSSEGERLLAFGADGTTTDITAGSGLEKMPANSVPTAVIAGDYDNDGAPDLFVLRMNGSSLYHNDGKGHFTDATRTAKLPAISGLPSAAAFVDVDHDGDLDLVIARVADLAATHRQRGAEHLTFPASFAPGSLLLLRNNGNGTFTDATRAAGLDRRSHAIAIVPTDYDNHRDIDLLVVNADGAPQLYANQRNGSFRDVAVEAGLTFPTAGSEVTTAVAVGDINKDDWPDFFFSRSGESLLALSNGRGRFNMSAAPERLRGATAAQIVDYDNDGLPDIVAMTPDGLAVVRDAGPSLTDVSQDAVASTAGAHAAIRSMSVADVDRNGTPDLVTTSGAHGWLWRNSGDARNHSLRVQLRGRVTNRMGIGAKVQVRAGSLSGRVETSAASPAVAPAEPMFGLGPRAGADVTRVLWPSGILQAETAPSGGGSQAGTLPSPFLVEELDRKPSSCPFLFAWDGERFEFVTDFLGGGEMGYWESPGTYNTPDPVEYVRIPGDRLKAVNGRLQLRITNELEEVLYLDRLQLTTVGHPSDVEVFPNEGMTTRPKAARLIAVRRPHVPRSVVDDHGHDVTPRIAALDRTWPDDFALERIRGYAGPHSLTIDLGNVTTGQTLLLTGWTDYAFSSDNVAAQQAGLSAEEPRLEVQDAHGRWRALDVAIGIPVGRPQTIPLDLSQALRAGEHLVRLTTSMRIYWDQIRVGDTASTDGFTSATVDPRAATLRARGFSQEVRPRGEEPPTYDYARVTSSSPWKVFAGAYTREGDVLPLVTSTDDRFVIARSGDEIAVEFDAADRLSVPDGWTRTYLLMGDGYSKEMDVNSASPDTVEPLPFHGMSKYPYPASEHYPDNEEYRQYQERYNTRRVARQVPGL